MNHSIMVVLKFVGGLLLTGLVGLLFLYALFAPVSSSGPKPVSEATADPGSAGLPNPASAYCREQGGHLFVITASDGSQYGVCIFPNGSACDEWDFYRGECGPSGGSAATSASMLTLKPETAAPGQPIAVNGSGFAPAPVVPPDTAYEDAARAVLDETLSRVLGPEPGVTVEKHLVEGAAGEVIVTLASECDLLVVGTQVAMALRGSHEGLATLAAE